MAEQQFLHVDCHGRVSREPAKPFKCIGGVIAEAARIPGHCPHIKHPAQPRLVYGETLEEIAAAATLLSMQARDKKGRRLRRDGAVLIAGVVSYPVPRADMTGSIAEREFYEHWKTETIEWLVNSSDIAVRSIIEHTDEEYPHLHFFALPTLTVDFRLNFDAVHPGRKAADEATARGVCQAAVQSAYLAAMVEWQNNYHRRVSARFGHQRLGPRRQRVTRERQKAIRQTERESEKARADLELQYMLARTPEEVAALARQVNPEDFKLVALAEIMRLRQLLALKTEVIREYGLVDPEEAPPPLPSDQELPAFPAIPVAELLEVLDELDELETFPEMQPAPAESVAAAAWAGEYFARKRAKADQLRSDISGRQEDPEAARQRSAVSTGLSGLPVRVCCSPGDGGTPGNRVASTSFIQSFDPGMPALRAPIMAHRAGHNRMVPDREPNRSERRFPAFNQGGAGRPATGQRICAGVVGRAQ